jgi:type I restriction enzyme M protein
VSEANVKPRSGGRSHNPSLKGVLPKDYARPALDKTRLGQLIDLVSNIEVGDEAHARDVLWRDCSEWLLTPRRRK